MHAYHDLLREVLHDGERRPNRTGVNTLSVFGAAFDHDLRKGFPLCTTKHISLRNVFYELKWILLGETDETWLRERKVTIWEEWATREKCAKFGRQPGDLGPIYGHQLRRFGSAEREGGYDQLAALFNRLASDPMSRRHVVTMWHPEDAELVELPPCHLMWHLYVHVSGELSLKLDMRSADLFLGVPYNIASYALLLSLIGHVTGRPVRRLTISFTDLHLYETALEQAQMQITRTPRELPRLRINDRLAGRGLAGLLDCEWKDIELSNYLPHNKLEAPVAV